MVRLLWIGIGYLGVTLALPSAPGADPQANAVESEAVAAKPYELPGEAKSAQGFGETPAEAPPVDGGGGPDLVRQGQAVFTGAGGCNAFHTVGGLATGLLGPDLTHIGTDSADRKPGISARDYITESIRSPEAFFATGTARAIPGIMTGGLTANLSDTDV